MEVVKAILVRVFNPLRSQVVRAALAVVLGGYLAEFGIAKDAGTLERYLTAATVVALGIAGGDKKPAEPEKDIK